MLLGSGELGKEVIISLQRLGIEVIATECRLLRSRANRIARRLGRGQPHRRACGSGARQVPPDLGGHRREVRLLRRVERHDPAPPMTHGHIRMVDPEGNEFCLD